MRCGSAWVGLMRSRETCWLALVFVLDAFPSSYRGWRSLLPRLARDLGHIMLASGHRLEVLWKLWKLWVWSKHAWHLSEGLELDPAGPLQNPPCSQALAVHWK